jgi:hypothetical protein
MARRDRSNQLMATTTNFGWETPDDTDLVKDGALAMRTLGNSIDTSFVDLKGGTTGQILSKASNTDLDYTWINNDQGDITAVTAGTGISGGGTSGAVTITNSMATEITAAGDIIIGTGSGTFDNLPIGTTGQVLTADTTVSPYKVKWAAAGASSGPAFRAFRNTSTQSVTGNVWTKVQLNAETFDTGSCFDSATNYRFTPTTAGYYNFTGKINGECQEGIGFYVWSAIYKNGSEASLGTKGPAPQDEGTSIVSDLIYMNGTTDYVELYGYITAGTPSEYFYNGTTKTYFEGVWIRS